MGQCPDSPKIYHITHLRNVPQIVRTGVVWSDAKRIELGLDCEIVGMSEIKRRRLEELEVSCHPDTKVGEYVPFYFCPRSIMLYILYKANHPELTYREGQKHIVHLQADLRSTIRWADANGVLWAFSDCNAGTRYAQFYCSSDDLDEIDWTAVAEVDFRSIRVKEGKQAEFLVYESFPWSQVEKIGVLDEETALGVNRSLGSVDHRPIVEVEPRWYF